MRKFIEVAAVASLVVLSAPASDALAAPRCHGRSHQHCDYYVAPGRRPLLIERRSFLDPGTKVPVGTYQNYVNTPAYVWGDPVATYQRSWYMDENLHQAFDPQPERRAFDHFGPFGPFD
ncbi:MAG TPA: hypothetical protein VEH76_01720 [Methylocystis sp.]|nr:hypothetical protein [Methylocystis sp.]